MFLVYIDDLPGYIKNKSKIALFADDSKIYKTISKLSDSEALQEDLSCLSVWCKDWNMDFNTSKCKALNISKKKSPTVRNYQLNNESLVTVKQITDLGISINYKLLWSSHIAQISKRANRILGLVKRSCKDFPDFETRKLLYCQIVRPILEYVSELWSPYISYISYISRSCCIDLAIARSIQQDLGLIFSRTALTLSQ